MLEEYKRLAKIWSMIKFKKNVDLHNTDVKEISKALPPEMLKQIGGMGALQSLIKQLGSK